ncbi:MAG: hypothetical protein JWM49_2138 [Microbacteriaceae bacterium]|nr:hypothetical protein [Microbacteriaceae bacterium]
MSSIVAVKIFGDTSAFIKSLDERAGEYRDISARSQDAGAIHHQFAIGHGFILVNDEWESAEAFEKFFADPELQAFIGSVGGDPNKAPEITIGEAVDSPDRF